MTDEQQSDVLKHLLKKNSVEYNHLKAVEELAELTEVLIKKVNKMGQAKEPANQEIVDEIGDVLIRLAILNEMYGHDTVAERIDLKLSKFQSMIDEGKVTNI